MTQLLREFTAKLFLLQNMVSKEFLIHDRLNNQYYGSHGVCVLTPEQYRVAVKVIEKFKRGGKVELLIRGCLGSGKTLLLMHFAEEFLKHSEKNDKVFIYIDSANELLTNLLREHIEGRNWHSKAFVGHRVPDEWRGNLADVKLILWDEFWFPWDNINNLRGSHLEVFNLFAEIQPSFALFTSQEQKFIDRGKGILEDSTFLLNIEQRNLTGNLRSSNDIIDMVQEVQHHLTERRWACKAPVSSSLEFRCSVPTLSFIDDDSDDRRHFLEECRQMIQNLAKEKGTVMVSSFMHGILRHQLESSLSNTDSVSFGDSYAILGCQYQCMVVVLDVATFLPPCSELIDVMTRATTSLHFIINASRKPILIEGIPSVRLEVYLRHQLENRCQELISEVGSLLPKKVLVFDWYNLLSDDFVAENQSKVVLMKTKMNEDEWRRTVEEHSLVVSIDSGVAFDSRLTCFSRSPVIQIQVTSEDVIEKFKEKYSLNHLNDVVLDFFLEKRPY